MRAWGRLGLLATALWVVASCVYIVYQGEISPWRDVRGNAFTEWHRGVVESETGRSAAEWDLQVRVARESCAATEAKKSAPSQQACNISPFYAEPTAFEWWGIRFDALKEFGTNLFREFLIPIAIWSFFVPFAVWFIGLAVALFILRLGDSSERPNRFKDLF